MTTATRTHSPIRAFFMVPAYTMAFALPAAALIGTFIGMNAYCATQPNLMEAPAMCVGLAHWQESLPAVPEFTLPQLTLPEFNGF